MERTSTEKGQETQLVFFGVQKLAAKSLLNGKLQGGRNDAIKETANTLPEDLPGNYFQLQANIPRQIQYKANLMERSELENKRRHLEMSLANHPQMDDAFKGKVLTMKILVLLKVLNSEDVKEEA